MITYKKWMAFGDVYLREKEKLFREGIKEYRK